MKLQLHLLPLLIQSAISTPISPETSLSLSPSLALFDPSAETATLPPLNTSSTFNTSILSPHFLPHRFRVPRTDIVLYLGFGIIRRRIDPAELQSMFLIAKDKIQRGIDAHGRDTLLPAHGNDHRQQYVESGLGTVYMLVSDHKVGEPFSWGNLWDVVEGLQLYLLEGEVLRNFVTNFAFWEEPEGESRHYHRRLGKGYIGERKSSR